MAGDSVAWAVVGIWLWLLVAVAAIAWAIVRLICGLAVAAYRIVSHYLFF